MTENDKKLIEQARTMNCISYMDIYDLIEKADTEEAKSQLHSMQIYKRLLDEKSANGYI